MRILLTNDDGHDAEGLATLYHAAGELGEVLVVAPDRQHSRQSHAITTTEPIELRRSARFKDGWQCSGTPADCVRLGLRHLPIGPIDLVMAGINHGGNLGVEVFYSGTIAAAREAALLGVPGIAVSQLLRDHSEDWPAARRMTARALCTLWELAGAGGSGAGQGSVNAARLAPLTSINLPAPADGKEMGVTLAALSPDPLVTSFTPPVDEGASTVRAQYRARYFDRPARPESDVHAVFNNWITITMMNVDGSAWKRVGAG
jgi:5'-nucleotidase